MDARRLAELLLSRRDVLRLLGAGAIAACSDGGGASPADAGLDAARDLGPDAAPPDLPWDVWRELRAALRESPDHFTARAEAVVATRDPRAIHAFVRDAIRTIPDQLTDDLSGSATRVRWGWRAALRSGVGTPREKADLLVELYRQAGFEAEVYAAGVDLRGEALHALFRGPRAPFEPAVTPETQARWRGLLGLSGAVPSADDAAAQETAALAAPVLAAMPLEWADDAPARFTRLRSLPVVQVTLDGVARFADPVRPDVPFGDAGAADPPVPAGPPKELMPVRVALSYAQSDEADERVVLVERTYAAAEVVGRQVVVALAPALPLEGLATTAPEKVSLFAPLLAVNGPDVTPELAESLVVTGDPLTLRAERITVDPMTGEVRLGENAVGTPPAEGAPTPAEVLAQVATLQVYATAFAFPDVRLRVAALDAAGAQIAGLTAQAFRVVDEGAPYALQLRSGARPITPKICIIVDVSASIPRAFKGDSLAQIVRDFATRIQTQAPDAEFMLGDFGAGFVEVPYTTDVEAVAAGVLEAGGAFSPLWGTVTNSVDQRPTVTVFFTDGEPSDEGTAARLRRLRAGPPVIGIHVTPDDPSGVPFFELVAEVTGGAYFPVTEPQQAVDAVVGFIERHLKIRYIGDYETVIEGPEERRVTLSTADGRVTAEATYRVPPPDQRTRHHRLVGVYLTVEVGDRRTDRVLAGYPGGGYDDTRREVWHAEVKRWALGQTVLFVEGGAPTASAWLEDHLAVRFALRPYWEAALREDVDAARAALQAGLPVASLGLPPFVPPLPDSPESPTFEGDLRVVLMQVVPDLSTGFATRKIDLFPVTRFATIAPDAADAFRRTVERTMRLALAEQRHFGTSTASLLAGQPLVAMGTRTRLRDVLPDLDAEQTAAWNVALAPYGRTYRLLPASGAPVAFWSIEPNTGTVTGALHDGSGGGSQAEEIATLIRKIESTIDLLGIGLGVAAGGANLPGVATIGILMAYGKFLAVQYLRAAIVISSLSAATTSDVEVARSILSLACDAMRASFPNVPVLGSTWFATLELLAGSVFDCAGAQFCNAIGGAEPCEGDAGPPG